MGLATARASIGGSFCICSSSATITNIISAEPLRRSCHFLPTSASPLLLCFQKKCPKLNLQTSVRDATEYSKVAVSSSSLLNNVETSDDDDACELVNGVEVSLGDGDDDIRAYLFTAVKNNNGTGLLLLSDIYGFEDSFTKDFAYRLACNGYNILVPDLFRGKPWTKEQPKTTTLFEQWVTRHNNSDRIAKDITTWTKWLVDEFMAAGISLKLGIISMSFGGGRLLLEVLAQDSCNFATGVSFYGTTKEEEQVASSDIKVPVLFILGDNDPLCAVSEMQENITQNLRGSKVVIFPGRGHGFAHRPASPEEDIDAEQAYLIVRDWLYDHLVMAG